MNKTYLGAHSSFLKQDGASLPHMVPKPQSMRRLSSSLKVELAEPSSMSFPCFSVISKAKKKASRDLSAKVLAFLYQLSSRSVRLDMALFVTRKINWLLTETEHLGYLNYNRHSGRPEIQTSAQSQKSVLQLWVNVACYQHETPKKKTNQEASMVLAVCVSDKTSLGTARCTCPALSE